MKNDKNNENSDVELRRPTIPGKGNEPAKVSKLDLKNPDPVEMSEADKMVSRETRPFTPDSDKQKDLAVNKGGG